MCALLALILAKNAFRFNMEMPKSFTYGFQMFFGLMVDSSFQPKLIKMFGNIAIPVITSTII